MLGRHCLALLQINTRLEIRHRAETEPDIVRKLSESNTHNCFQDLLIAKAVRAQIVDILLRKLKNGIDELHFRVEMIGPRGLCPEEVGNKLVVILD